MPAPVGQKSISFPKATIQKSRELGFCSLCIRLKMWVVWAKSFRFSSIIFEQLAYGCTATTAMMTIHKYGYMDDKLLGY